jgi:hypothetical protein
MLVAGVAVLGWSWATGCSYDRVTSDESGSLGASATGTGAGSGAEGGTAQGGNAASGGGDGATTSSAETTGAGCVEPGPCGHDGEACCTCSAQCSDGSNCNGASCVCGGAGEGCCGGTACDGGLVCSGVCTPCGGIGQPCCANDVCNDEWPKCISGVCLHCCAVCQGEGMGTVEQGAGHPVNADDNGGDCNAAVTQNCKNDKGCGTGSPALCCPSTCVNDAGWGTCF